MSRYLILIILNTPLVLAAILAAIASYKLGRSSKRRLIFRLVLWLSILSGLLFAEPLYIFLFSNQLTETEPLSLFDVIQITGIIFTIFIANQAFSKAANTEQKLQELHQKLSIRLSQKK